MAPKLYEITAETLSLELLLQYDWDVRKKRIHWSDANFIKAIQLGFQELHALVNTDAAGSSQHLNVDDQMVLAWRAQLHDQMKQSKYQEILKTIINEVFVEYDRSQVCLGFTYTAYSFCAFFGGSSLCCFAIPSYTCLQL